jgi:hypothetical protein
MLLAGFNINMSMLNGILSIELSLASILLLISKMRNFNQRPSELHQRQ